MTRDNKKFSVKGNITDPDANSLYPSAQKIGYHPAGIPKVLT